MFKWYFDIDRALGMGITNLSLMLHTKEQIEITIIKPWSIEKNSMSSIIRVFDVESRFPVKLFIEPDLTPELKSKMDDSENFPTHFTDMTKFISPYFHSDYICFLNQQIPINYKTRLDKPCIGIAINNYLEEGDSIQLQNVTMPYCRYYPREVWTKIIDMILSFGYEVIILHDNRISIDQKVYLLNEHCAGVIGYEGGVCHLSHLLKIPTIVLPWHHGPDGRKDYEFLNIHPHRFHTDPHTWFPSSIDEVLGWSKHKFNNLLYNLINGKGNNIFLDSETKFHWDEHTPDILATNPKTPKFFAHLSVGERKFIDTYCKHLY